MTEVKVDHQSLINQIKGAVIETIDLDPRTNMIRLLIRDGRLIAIDIQGVYVFDSVADYEAKITQEENSNTERVH